MNHKEGDPMDHQTDSTSMSVTIPCGAVCACVPLKVTPSFHRWADARVARFRETAARLARKLGPCDPADPRRYDPAALLAYARAHPPGRAMRDVQLAGTQDGRPACCVSFYASMLLLRWADVAPVVAYWSVAAHGEIGYLMCPPCLSRYTPTGRHVAVSVAVSP
jgi:hypothetical protein